MIDWLLQPSIGLSLLLSLIYTSAVHLFMRLGYRHFLRHWFVAIIGMAAGAAVAARTGSHLPALGDMHVIEMSAAAVVLLLFAGLKSSPSHPETFPEDS